MSSRNVYLSKDERQQALVLNRTLHQAAEMAQNGESDAEKILTMAGSLLAKEADLNIDYVKICNAQSLEEVDTIDHESVMLLAVSVGKTRLIDNGNLIS